MSARAEVLELSHPLVIPEERVRDAMDQIEDGKCFVPVNKFEVFKQAQDVTPEALLHERKRYVLLISNEGKGMIEIMHTDKDQEYFEVEKNGTFYLMEDAEDINDEGDGEKFIRVYGIINLL